MEATRSGKRFRDEDWAKENKNEIVNTKEKETKIEKIKTRPKERKKEQKSM